MMMMGLHFMGEVPFDTVYVHALVRDEKGQKMSKSKGNVVDPLDLIEKYGADALRFTLTSQAAQGRDVKLAESRVEGYRNFATKLWNAARFCEMNECVTDPDFDPAAVQLQLNRWIVHEVKSAFAEVEKGLDDYKFNEAANASYHFVWGTFCDWYVEFAKPHLQGEGRGDKIGNPATAAWALEQILHLMASLHAIRHGRAVGALGRTTKQPTDQQRLADLSGGVGGGTGGGGNGLGDQAGR